MKKLLAVAAAGMLVTAVVGLGNPTVAQADIVDDAASACRGRHVGGDWNASADCEGLLLAWHDTFQVIMSAGASHVEECLNEGCVTEEVREMHRMYKEEMISESGGSYHEMMEIAVGVWQGPMNAREEAIAILGMLDDFNDRGWQFRNGDVANAINNSF